MERFPQQLVLADYQIKFDSMRDEFS